MTTTIAPGAEAKEFLVALEAAQPRDWLRIPGLGGPYRAEHLRLGLKTGAIVLHWSGRGFCWGTSISPGMKGDVVALRPEVGHLEALILRDDRYPPASLDAVKKLLATFKRMQFGLDKATEEDPFAID